MTESRVRLTQAERTLATRTKLLDATIECLVSVGYARTTTTEVSALAKVSRGAQLHHFPSREALVAAAIEHVFAKHQAEFRALASAQPAPDIDTVIDMAWAIFTSSTYYAWLELLLASRTDPTLRKIAMTIAARADTETDEIFKSLVAPPPGLAPFADVLGAAIWATFQGMGVARICVPNSKRHRDILASLKTVARLYFPAQSEPAVAAPAEATSSAAGTVRKRQEDVLGSTTTDAKPKKRKRKTTP